MTTTHVAAATVTADRERAPKAMAAHFSGIGCELSLESMLEHFTWSKTVIINYGTPGV
jgi:hypothetical protein